MYLVAGASAFQVPADDPDALYKDRENLASARTATDIWTARLKSNPRDFVSAWKLAQARYWLGTNGLPEPQRKGALEAGIEAARTAIAIDAGRPEGHFWLAANMGALAESFGIRVVRVHQDVRVDEEPIAQATRLATSEAFTQGRDRRANETPQAFANGFRMRTPRID